MVQILFQLESCQVFRFLRRTIVKHGVTTRQRQSVYARLAGYEDLKKAERLNVNPVVRYVFDGRAVDRVAASTSKIGQFKLKF